MKFFIVKTDYETKNLKLGYTYRYARSRNFSFWYYDCKDSDFFNTPPSIDTSKSAICRQFYLLRRSGISVLQIFRNHMIVADIFYHKCLCISSIIIMYRKKHIPCSLLVFLKTSIIHIVSVFVKMLRSRFPNFSGVFGGFHECLL